MGISNAGQFVLLLWKNWLLQKKRKIVTACQILLPVVIAFALLGIRAIRESEFKSSPKIWDSFEASTTLPPNLTLTMTIQSDSFELSTTLHPNQTLTMPMETSTTLPPNLTSPMPTAMPMAMPIQWMLVYSPNTSPAANRMAKGITQMLNITPVPIGMCLTFTSHVYLTTLCKQVFAVEITCVCPVCKQSHLL